MSVLKCFYILTFVLNCLEAVNLVPWSERIKEAACFANSIDESNMFTGRCQQFTNKCTSNTSIELRQVEGWVPNLEFVCRTESMLRFKWDCEDCVSVIGYRTFGQKRWRYRQTTNCKTISLASLEPQSSYQVQLRVLNGTEISAPIQSKWISTAAKTSKPLQVQDFFIKELKVKKGIPEYEIVLGWTPAEDFPCYYDILIIYGRFSYKQKEIRDFVDVYEITVDNLKFESEYSFSVMAVNHDWTQEGPRRWINITTPSCIETYHSLDICPPPSPEDLVVKETHSDNQSESSPPLHNLQIHWKMPELHPDYYTIELIVFLPYVQKTYYNVSGEANEVNLTDVYVGDRFKLEVIAHSKAGPSEPTMFFQVAATKIPVTSVNFQKILIITAICLGFLVVLAITICHVYRIKSKKNKNKQNNTTLETICEDPGDEWEIDRNNIILGPNIGQGAFGVVQKGFLKKPKGDTILVAVKTLYNCASPEEKAQFIQEIDIMKTVGNHKNLVCLLGCCIMNQAMPLLIVEFCANGDLKTYLQRAWALQTSQVFMYGNSLMNRIYFGEDDRLVKQNDMLSFARQIASGMKYLSNMRVVHRDLAARNVLICEDMTLKISDFGLSRDVYRSNFYHKCGSGMLPIRWLALESLTHQLYTVQSDVWSYGILLWEIYSLGGNPYPELSISEVLPFLERGHRMAKPENCPTEMYDLMLSCWKSAPKERPTFTEICKLLQNLN